MNSFTLTIGDEFNSPESLRFCESEGGISPGIDTELVEETVGIFDALIYDSGTETGFVLVKET